MKIEVNGKMLELDAAELPLAKFIADRDYDPGNIVIEHNGSILEHDDYEKVLLRDTDRLLIVSFVGGG